MSPSRFTESVRKPPRLVSVASILWLLVVLCMYSDAGVGIGGLFLLMFGSIGLILIWVARACVFVALKRQLPVQPAAGLWWLVGPACVAVAILIGVLFEAPNNPMFLLRFRLSEPAL